MGGETNERNFEIISLLYVFVVHPSNDDRKMIMIICPFRVTRFKDATKFQHNDNKGSIVKTALLHVRYLETQFL